MRRFREGDDRSPQLCLLGLRVLAVISFGIFINEGVDSLLISKHSLTVLTSLLKNVYNKSSPLFKMLLPLKLADSGQWLG